MLSAAVVIGALRVKTMLQILRTGLYSISLYIHIHNSYITFRKLRHKKDNKKLYKSICSLSLFQIHSIYA